jgi:uncharacterized protein YjbI with pentapeptide repeats
MTTSPDSESDLPPAPTNQIQQNIDETKGQVIAQMMGGLAIGQLIVYLSQAQTEAKSPQPDTTKLGNNPYRGLLAFRETDGDRFFGRETQIEQLWEKFCHLHENQSTVRVLPIYGPSGSGKSSLARAGLIPALGKKPLPGRDRARLAVLVPGTHPLEALATVLARIATNDLTPVKKSQEFEEALKTKSDKGNYEGLRRIADTFPDIAISPLIVLVDQFEEVYTYALSLEKTEREAFIAERDAFIENLLCAAAEPTKRVSVILTLRSDFLGDTQQHPRLNKLFSTQGFLVPIMQPEELEIAIAKPAEQAGDKLDKAIVKLLVEQTQGREGALPLLQFALTRIWEGLQNGVDPAETLHNIGGVGGALAGEAQRLYQSLSVDDQAIARCIFLALVQLNEDSGDTRRRAAVSELIGTDADEIRVRSIINLFADPRVRFLVRFSDKQYGEMIEMIEVAHEALIRNWKQLRDWLKECREALRKKRKIEDAAEEWKHYKKSKDYLLQGRALRDARAFMQAAKKEITLSSLAAEFVKAGVRKHQINILRSICTFFIFPLISAIIIAPEIFIAIQNSHIDRAKKILFEDNCEPNPNTRDAIKYMLTKKYGYELSGIKLCKENLPNIDISGTDISKSDLRGINLGGAKLRRTFLIEAKLQDAKLIDADLYNAILQDAQMQRAQLQLSILKDSTLRGANLENAGLEGADLSGADLSGADLSGANLSDTSLVHTDLKQSKGLSIEQLKQAATLCGTKLPQKILESSQKQEIIRLMSCPLDHPR